MALQLLRATQNAYYIQAVQDALQAEEQRKQKLHKATNKQEVKRLESQFTRERSADRERLCHIQEDHALLLNAKIAEWKTAGGIINEDPTQGGIESTQALEFYKNVYRKQDRARLSRNAAPQTRTTSNLHTVCTLILAI
eukprot:jgi/Phyca11/4135/fgenesh1_pm.PHYCAscaffold_1_\